MSLFMYIGFVALTLVIGAAVRWIDPAALEQIARKTGLRRSHGWILFIVATVWMFLPVLAGANTSEGSELWMAGAALSAAGFYLGAFALTSVDEHRLLSRATVVQPDEVTVGDGDRLLATSGVPAVESDTDARTPFTVLPAVHTDWILQKRDRMGGIGRKQWHNVATDVQSVSFTLGETVRVDAGRHRIFSNTDLIETFSPDDPLPDAARSIFRGREGLPNPDEREKPYRAVETVVRADEPVTVVGTPKQGDRPGERRFESAPADQLLETHGETSAGGSPEVVLVGGEATAAASLLGKRVYGLGIGGLVLIFGGQLLAFVLSSASLTALY